MVLCPACESSSNVGFEKSNGYEMHKCIQCSLIFSSPMRAGNEEFYEGHIVYDQVTESRALQQKKAFNHRENRNLLQKFPSNARLLDIGCGYGAFTALAVEMGLDAYGIDFNSSTIAVGQKIFGLEDRLRVGRIEDLHDFFLDGGYDLITLFEVIEHVEDPKALINQVSQLLKPGGTLVLSCPNESRWMPAGRIFVDYPPHHLTRWNPLSLGGLLRGLNFSSISIEIDASFRDLFWTAYVNRSALQRLSLKEEFRDIAPIISSGQSWKHILFDLSAIVFSPFDLILKALNIGTMGMRTTAKKGIEVN